ncbi:MAG: hypothetical protein RMM28_07625, partial [Thermoleophilia bacterium]|nr:hypothetical protein [Thermoleophilia bacterium]
AGEGRLQRNVTHPARAGAYATGAQHRYGVIPGNFLNEGLATVHAEVSSLRSTKIFPHAMTDPIAFYVEDPGEGDSAKGRFTGQWKGVVRPLLEWTVEEE